MATFSDDMSGHTVGDKSDKETLTGITGYTGLFNAAGSTTQQNIEIISSTNPLGGTNIMRFTEDYNLNTMVCVTALGDQSGAVHAKVLYRVNNLTANAAGHFQIRMPAVKINTDTPTNANGLGLRKEIVGENTEITHRASYMQGAADWFHMGAVKDVASTYVAGDWWWHELLVTAGNLWSWKTWKNGDSVPAWDREDVSQATLTTGWVGMGIFGCTRDPVDVAFFSVGTGADSAPDPSAPAGPIVLRTRRV